MKRFAIFAIATFILGGCASTAKPNSRHMKRSDFPGAQDASQPHPGTIIMKYEWNGTSKELRAADHQDSFNFFCFDSEGKRADRSAAAWCVPVVEIETVSADKNGQPAEPRVAEYIEITAYGPRHKFLEHTTAQPRSQRLPPRSE
ncbi:hypothetical protein QCE63_08950 [Caballeronia sp. LZ065]|uniref:hypothetical protein n=1 Tax=Caballeronia sp. LZ065 TaxID=3038571 RepID=UPI00285C741F|nr:hypothetical protein [Caballeronia sp. LZ065]MDR5779555.1 hypothetical protein [Caballeronia sp. LZ065]